MRMASEVVKKKERFRALMKKRVRGGASHPCPRCGEPTHVQVTRREEEHNRIVRWRECPSCKHRYRTKEQYLGAV